MRKILCGLVMLMSCNLYSQTPPALFAGAYSSNGNAFSFAENPALICMDTMISIGVYGEKKFMVNGLGNYSVILAVPFSNAGVGIRGNYSGSLYYHETNVSLAYGRRLNDRLAVGAEFSRFSIGIASPYGKQSIVYGGMGLVFKLSANIVAGISISNPFEIRFGLEKQEVLNGTYKCCFTYEPSRKVSLTFGIEKKGNATGTTAALQYLPVKRLILSAGLNTSYSGAWFSAGFLFHGLRVDLCSYFHPRLGISPSSFIQYRLPKSSGQ